MKTRNIALIILASAALMLSACANEPEIENGEGITFDKDESMFKIGSVQTRSAEEIESTTHDVASVTLDNGETFTLKETVTSLDDVETAPETRGTPAFTQNVKQVYGSFYTYAMKEGGSAAFAKTQAAGVGGVKYTLKVEKTGAYSYLHLIDKVAEKDINLLEEDEYSCVGSPADNDDRFIVRLELAENAENSVFAYQSGNDIIVSGEGELQVFDVMGRLVMQKYVSGVESIATPMTTGVYILRLNDKTQKIIIK